VSFEQLCLEIFNDWAQLHFEFMQPNVSLTSSLNGFAMTTYQITVVFIEYYQIYHYALRNCINVWSKFEPILEYSNTDTSTTIFGKNDSGILRNYT